MPSHLFKFSMGKCCCFKDISVSPSQPFLQKPLPHNRFVLPFLGLLPNLVFILSALKMSDWKSSITLSTIIVNDYEIRKLSKEQLLIKHCKSLLKL